MLKLDSKISGHIYTQEEIDFQLGIEAICDKKEDELILPEIAKEAATPKYNNTEEGKKHYERLAAQNDWMYQDFLQMQEDEQKEKGTNAI